MTASQERTKPMPDPTPKKRGSSPLTPTQAADRVAQALSEFPERLKRALADAEKAERTGLQSYVENCMARVPEAERDKVARVLLALGTDLCGMELSSSANDPVPRVMGDQFRDSDGLPDAMPEAIRNDLAWLDQQVPPVDRIEVDRSTGEARRVGKGRAK